MKQLQELTEEQAKHICELAGEPFLSFMVNSHGAWTSLGLEIQIETTSTVYGNCNDSCIWIYKNGTVALHRNNGDWGGSRYEKINALPITDYLREQGYFFDINFVSEL